MSKAKMTYAEKLRRPEWQRKRLEILNRDGFACTSCGDKETELHVHHGYYEKGVEPWEYPDHSLQTLCRECHAETEELRRVMLGELAGVSLAHWQAMCGVALAVRTIGRDSVGRIARGLWLADNEKIVEALTAVAEQVNQNAPRRDEVKP